MNGLKWIVEKVLNLFRWWFVVLPWESGLRVTLGKRVTTLGPGIHLRIPVVHTVFKQSVRLRREDMPTQTLFTTDGKTLTIVANLQYSILDVAKLYNTLHEPTETIRTMFQSAIADFVTSLRSDQCSPEKVVNGALVNLNVEQYGLSDVKITITDFAFLKTYRLVQDSRWSFNNRGIDTSQPAI